MVLSNRATTPPALLMFLLTCCLLFGGHYALECGSSYQHQRVAGVKIDGGTVTLHGLDRESMERVSASTRSALRDFRFKCCS